MISAAFYYFKELRFILPQHKPQRIFVIPFFSTSSIRSGIYLDPGTTMEVTLPVPTTYPTMNRPGMMEFRKILFFSIEGISE